MAETVFKSLLAVAQGLLQLAGFFQGFGQAAKGAKRKTRISRKLHGRRRRQAHNQQLCSNCIIADRDLSSAKTLAANGVQAVCIVQNRLVDRIKPLSQIQRISRLPPDKTSDCIAIFCKQLLALPGQVSVWLASLLSYID